MVATTQGGRAPAEVHVRFTDVHKTFPGGSRGVPDKEVLRGVDLEIRRGEIFGVMGYSGAGKSTLVRLINGLERPSSGRIEVDGKDITAVAPAAMREIQRGIGMVFQQFNLFRSRTIAGNVAYPLKVAGVKQPERDKRVAELLHFVGLLDRANDYPEQLSGGQRQRVGVARALATRPALLLADEATSALDPETTADVLRLLQRVNTEQGITVVIITHELDVLRTIADRVAVLDSGRVVESGDVYDVFAHPKSGAARRFVGATLKDRPSPDTVRRLKEIHQGRIVSVQVSDDPRFQAELTRTFDAHEVSSTIVFGGISELQDRPVGSLTFALSGGDTQVDAVIAQLRSTGHNVEEEI